jgi:hypothetical protein
VKKLITLLAALALLAAGPAIAGDGKGKGGDGKVLVCHKGKTLSVGAPALKAHLKHGDKAGRCQPGGGTTNPPGDTPVTADTFSQVNRILACASKPVIRVADGTLGIAVDLDLATFESGVYEDATFTVARYYAGVGATCDKLGGKPTGETVDGYPVWA